MYFYFLKNIFDINISKSQNNKKKTLKNINYKKKIYFFKKIQVKSRVFKRALNYAPYVKYQGERRNLNKINLFFVFMLA